jgi:hypothetical protein
LQAKGADSTWAIVVGIDAYAGGFRTLEGASLDAVYFYKWLNKLNVPDNNIRFHAEAIPGNQVAVDNLKLPVRACTLEGIAQSLLWLQEHQGSRLFVFLAGHGLHESTYGRVFIAQDATETRVQNLGLDWVGRYLQGLNYADQYLILDGCLNHPYPDNHKPELAPGTISGIEPRSRRDNVAQVFCAAARTGQLAEERGGRGAFTQEFLRAVDPDNPNPICQEVDLTDGTIRINLDSVVNKIIRPTFAQLELAQEPYASPEGDAPSPDSLVDLIPDAVARLSVRVEPPKATTGIERIALTSFNPSFRMDYPSSDVIAIPASIATVWPLGITIDARCAPKAGFSSDPDGVQSRVMNSDCEMVFTVEELDAFWTPPPSTTAVPGVAAIQAAIEFVRPSGVVSGLTEDGVDRIAGAVAGHPEALNLTGVPPLDVHLDMNWAKGVVGSSDVHPDLASQLGIGHTTGDMDLHLHDWGAIITCTPEHTHLLEPFGQAVADLINTYALEPDALDDPQLSEHTEARVRLRPYIVPSLSEDIAFDIEEPIYERDNVGSGVFFKMPEAGIARLAGLLWDEPILTVGDVTLSLREVLLTPMVPLAPGPWLVTLTLPWGTWNTTVAVEDTYLTVTLPESVGRSPLRVTFLDRAHVFDTVGLFRRPLALPAHAQTQHAHTVVTAGEELAPYSMGAAASTFVRDPAPVPWRGSLWRSGAAEPGPTVRVDTARTTLETALVGSGPVAMRLAPPYRAEPLSLTASPYWDTLIGAGRLEALHVGLISATWEVQAEPPMGVAIAYACFAQQSNDLLRDVLDSLDESAPDAPDVTFLRAVLDWRDGTHNRATAACMEELVDRVPWFHWGLNVGITAAQHYGVAPLKAALQSVSRRAAPESPWLIWEPELELDQPGT